MKNSHCSYCGSAFLPEQAWPRQCAVCDKINYLNPVPVAVGLVPVDDGLLLIRRTVAPRIGSLALPGGFINMGESWQQACVREIEEETGLRIPVEEVQLVDVLSAPDGTVLEDVKTLDADIVMGDDVSAKPVGTVHAEVANGNFSYSVNWSGPKVSVQELGWIFTLPRACDHFSWDRKAIWSYYPPTHIGRPRGTATPDSALQHVTKLTRPDAFDFTSTKYDCNWAALTDSSGKNGLCVRFAPNVRHQCMAGIGATGEGESARAADHYLTCTLSARGDLR